MKGEIISGAQSVNFIKKKDTGVTYGLQFDRKKKQTC